MKITSLGHGGAFAGYAIGNTSFLIEFDSGKKLLFDCGSLTPYILRDEFNINFHDIDAVYISHAHADHVGGLALFLQSRYWIPKLDPSGERVLPYVFVADTVLEEFEKSIILEVAHQKDGENKYLEDFANITAIGWGENGFEYEGVNFTLKHQNHVTYNNYEQKPVFGLEFKVNNKRVLLTADTSDVAHFDAYDVIFQDCEVGNYKSGVHAHFTDIQSSYAKAETAPEIYLVHFTNPLTVPLPISFDWFTKGNVVEL